MINAILGMSLGGWVAIGCGGYILINLGAVVLMALYCICVGDWKGFGYAVGICFQMISGLMFALGFVTFGASLFFKIVSLCEVNFVIYAGIFFLISIVLTAILFMIGKYLREKNDDEIQYKKELAKKENHEYITLKSGQRVQLY